MHGSYGYDGGPSFVWEELYEKACEEYPYEASHEPEPPVVDMRTFTGIIIDRQFIGGDCKNYYENGKLHRNDGPAIESLDGTLKIWYVNGVRHREDGPAFINKNNRTIWYKHGKKHRLDGPATEIPFNPRLNLYFIDGKELDKEAWEKQRVLAKYNGSLSSALKTLTEYAKALENNSLPKAINENAGATIKQNDDYIKLKCTSDLLKLDKINEEGGSRCQKCNEFNEYVADPYYVCYSCKNT